MEIGRSQDVFSKPLHPDTKALLSCLPERGCGFHHVAPKGSVCGQQTAEDWKNKSMALYEQGKYDEAVHAYEWAIKLDPDYALAWAGKGLALDSQGRYGEAILAYDEAIRLDPQYAEAWYNKGAVLEALGHDIEASTAFAKAKELGYGA